MSGLTEVDMRKLTGAVAAAVGCAAPPPCPRRNRSVLYQNRLDGPRFIPESFRWTEICTIIFWINRDLYQDRLDGPFPRSI